MRWSGGKSSIPSIWDTSVSDNFNVTEDEMQQLNSQLYSYQCSLDVMNIGLEAAKDVTIEWDMPLQQLVSLIKAADVNEILDISLKENFLELNINILSVQSMHSLNQKQKIDYALPSNDANQTPQVTLPSSYASLCSAILLLSALNTEKIDTLYTQIPKIIALLRYRDIGGKTISKKFSVSPEFSVLFMPTDTAFGQTVSTAGTSFAIGFIEVEQLYDPSPTDGLNSWLTRIFVVKNQMVTLLKQVKNQIRR